MAARVATAACPIGSTSSSSRSSEARANAGSSLRSGNGPESVCSEHSLSYDARCERSLGMAEGTWRRRESRRNRGATPLRPYGHCSSTRSAVHGTLLACVVVALLLTQLTPQVSAAAVGCPSSSFSPYGPSKTCYGYFQTSLNFFEAHVLCRSHNNGYLAVISNQGEFNFVQTIVRNKTADTSYRAWIGLTDKTIEGTFAWVSQGATASPAEFDASFWAKGQPQGLGTDHDCVVLEADGFHVSTLGCSEDTGHFFVCQQEMCVGSCAEAVISADGGADSGVIAGSVIAVVLFILIVLALLYTWKFHNDKWELYVCYLCKMRESKTQVHSLQQENQRLRRQLSQQKSVSQISLSGMGDIPGPNDGAGGVLPTLRPMAQMGTNAPNNAAALLPTVPNSKSPPPLRRQSTSQASAGIPVLGRNTSNMSVGQSRPATLSMSRQTSLLGGHRARITPDQGAPGGGMAGINSPRAGFVNMPPAFFAGQAVGGAGAGRPSMSRHSSSSSAYGGAHLMSPPRAAKVSIVPEDPDLEEREAAALEAGRTASRSSLPGGMDEED